MASLSRRDAALQGRDAVAIASRGAYTSPSGRTISVAADLARAVAATRDVRPEVPLEAPRSTSMARRSPVVVTVVDGTSLASARALAARGVVPLVLNFASAKKPGGGFLAGARAQEESLARSSALYPCLLESAMYAHHSRHGDPLYTSWMILSPKVPVFRDDVTGLLLEDPYLATFLTAPAPNAGAVLARDEGRRDEVDATMRARVTRALALAFESGHRHVVLGAWGCGVFRNDPALVADQFRVDLAGPFRNAFDEVVFAVLDSSPDRRFLGPFERAFGLQQEPEPLMSSTEARIGFEPTCG